jgi:hypothetical protein
MLEIVNVGLRRSNRYITKKLNNKNKTTKKKTTKKQHKKQQHQKRKETPTQTNQNNENKRV